MLSIFYVLPKKSISKIIKICFYFVLEIFLFFFSFQFPNSKGQTKKWIFVLQIFFHIFPTKIFFIKNPIKWPSFNIWREWPNELRHYNQSQKVPDSNPTWHSAGLFITVIWLSHSRLCATRKETTSLTQCLANFFYDYN